jgi:hypothetical protein
MNVEAVWLVPEGQQWEVVVRLQGGSKVRYRCSTRAEGVARVSSLMRAAKELSEGLTGQADAA